MSTDSSSPGPSRDRDARGRDRDARGRPRSARPRDALGRPLDHGSDGVPRLAEAPPGTPEESLDRAQRLLDAGRPFEAHEVLEDAWKAAPAAERDLWRGLAQLAVGLTHAARGNRGGAAALLARGAGNVAGYRDGAPYGIDVPGLLAWAAAAQAAVTEPAVTEPADAGTGREAPAEQAANEADARAAGLGVPRLGVPRLVRPPGRP